VVGAVALMRPREWGGLGPSVSVHSDSGGRVDRLHDHGCGCVKLSRKRTTSTKTKAVRPFLPPVQPFGPAALPFHSIICLLAFFGWAAGLLHTHTPIWKWNAAPTMRSELARDPLAPQQPWLPKLQSISL
jgi:hypothetical protein